MRRLSARALLFSLSFLGLVIGLGVSQAEAGSCPAWGRIPLKGDFAAPIPVDCLSTGAIEVYAPGMLDFFGSGRRFMGKPSFFTLTKEIDWKKSALSANSSSRRARVQELVKRNTFVDAPSLEVLLERAAKKEAKSRTEMNQIVQARCVLFLSSPVCKNVEPEKLLSCDAKRNAEEIIKNSRDETTLREKAQVLFEIMFKTGITVKTYQVFFVFLGKVAPNLVKPLEFMLTGHAYFKRFMRMKSDADEISKIERSSWLSSLVTSMRHNEIRYFCYNGLDHFKHHMEDALALIAEATAHHKSETPSADPAPSGADVPSALESSSAL